LPCCSSTHDLSLLFEFAHRIAIMYAGEVVELAPAAQLRTAAEHPYTLGLIRSFPSLTGPLERMTGIPGAAILVVVAYLIGALPFGLLVGRVAGGVDLREHGSGRIGATNALRTGWPRRRGAHLPARLRQGRAGRPAGGLAL